MEWKVELEKEARQEYLKERDVVNAEYEKMVQNEIEKRSREEEKKRKMYEIMLEQYELKEKVRREEEEKARAELKRI